eukprot:scaffold57014_cov53-Phaeocystis_antarctica.AAC.1
MGHLLASHRHWHPTTSQVLATSAQLPPDQRLVMYDACDGFAPQAPLGPNPNPNPNPDPDPDPNPNPNYPNSNPYS